MAEAVKMHNLIRQNQAKADMDSTLALAEDRLLFVEYAAEAFTHSPHDCHEAMPGLSLVVHDIREEISQARGMIQWR